MLPGAVDVMVPVDSHTRLDVTVEYSNTPGQSAMACVVAHPLASLGGDKDNYVVKFIADLLVAMGHVVWRYNTRGAGRSEGRSTWSGKQEVTDIVELSRAALGQNPDFAYPAALPAAPPKKVVVVGYSTGGMWASAALPQLVDALGAPAVAACIVVSPPYGVRWFLSTFNSDFYREAEHSPMTAEVPKLYIAGDSDMFTSASRFNRITSNIPGAQCHLYKGVDHFWTRGHERLHKDIQEFMSTVMASQS